MASRQQRQIIILYTLNDIVAPPTHFAAAYHQFHQYYIRGEFANCRTEKARMYNCFKWRGTGKDKFLVRARIKLRLCDCMK